MDINVIAQRLSESILAARGQQVNRKDKDLMRDTGGTSKGRDNEPDSKPPRDDVKERYRDRRKEPDKIDLDTNEDKDREVKHPSRRPQVRNSSRRSRTAGWVMWTPELVLAYCESPEAQPDKLPKDLSLCDVLINKNRGQPPFVCHYKTWQQEDGYIWGTGAEVAERLNSNRIMVPPLFLMHQTGHPLDEVEKSDSWGGLLTETNNYHQQVRGCLHGILETTMGVSEKDFCGQDAIMAEADRVCRTPEAEAIIQRFAPMNYRPSYCAECIFAEILMQGVRTASKRTTISVEFDDDADVQMGSIFTQLNSAVKSIARKHGNVKFETRWTP